MKEIYAGDLSTLNQSSGGASPDIYGLTDIVTLDVTRVCTHGGNGSKPAPFTLRDIIELYGD